MTQDHRPADEQARLRAIIDSALDCVITIDVEGVIHDYNPAAERTFGWSRDEALGRSLGELIVPAHLRAAHAGGMRRYLESGSSRILGRRLEVPAVCADGREIPVELTVVRQPGPGVPLFTAFLRDITERREAQMAMAEARRAAEAANRAKTEFLAVISHELRTPMNAILGMTDLALNAATTVEQRELLQLVQSNAEQLLGLVNEILDLSKLEAGQVELHPTDCDLGSLAEEVVEALATRARPRGLELTCWVEPTFPRALRADRARVRQVLMNLVDNAIKFTDEGAVALDVALVHTAAAPGEPQISAYGRPHGGAPLLAPPIAAASVAESQPPFDVPCGTPMVHFAIRDTGRGVPAEAVGQIFQPFFQVDSTTTRSEGGTGLGLSICQALVVQMGGTLRVETEVGRGSVFHVLLPAHTPATPEMDVSPPSHAFVGTRVAVVAHPGPWRRAAVGVLARLGLEPEELDDPAELVSSLAEATRPIGLVLFDARAPGAHAAVALALASHPRHEAPLVMCGEPVEPDSGLPSGHRLGNPVTRRRLVALLRRLSGANRSEESASSDPPHAHPLKVLLVDDHRDGRLYGTRLLRQLGHEVEAASSGVEALALFGRGRFDIVLADIDMPGLDGFELARAILDGEAAAGSDPTPIVALSAHAGPGFRERCLDAGLCDHLAKPFRARDLSGLLERHADTRPLVLVADDARDMRLLMRHHIAALGCRVVTAANGVEAVREVERGGVDLVLMDMNMPVLGGAAATRRIRDLPCGVTLPVVALTGDGPEEEARCLAAGCTSYLRKPIDPATLEGLLRRFVTGPKRGPSAPAGDDRGAAAALAGAVLVPPSIADLVPGYLASVTDDVADAGRALAAGRFEAARRHGHNLKGSGPGYGFQRIGALGAALEDAAAREDRDRASAALAELSRYFGTLAWCAGAQD